MTTSDSLKRQLVEMNTYMDNDDIVLIVEYHCMCYSDPKQMQAVHVIENAVDDNDHSE